MTTTAEHINQDGLDKCCLNTIILYPDDAVEGVILACRKCPVTITYSDRKWHRQKRE